MPEPLGHLIHIPFIKHLQSIITSKFTRLIERMENGHFILITRVNPISDNIEALDEYYSDRGKNPLSDVWTGTVIQEQISEFFKTKSNLALSIFTDGVPLFKSNQISLWPVLLQVLNLPPSIRFKAENIIMCGMWYGIRKPDMKLLLDPVVKTLEDLYRDGFETQISSGKMHMKVKLMFGVFDLVARPTVIYTKQFNGEFCCPVCYHPGKRLPNGARIYLPRDYPFRTYETIIQDGTLAESTGNSVNGSVGISPLAHTINLVDGIPVDDMHCAHEGIVKRLMSLWFESSNHTEPYYLGRNTAAIDRVLIQQHPPHEFSRCPRSIAKHLKFWKASEFKNWLLFYLLPLLLDYLPSLYLHHYALLTCMCHAHPPTRINRFILARCCGDDAKRFYCITSRTLWRI